jgi:lipopolysaccharide assembly protein A
MSTSAQIPGKGEPKGAARPKVSKREIALVVLAILITLFAVFNFKEVKVSYVVGTGKAPLIIVIVVSLLVGIVLAYFGERRPRKRRR